jgi:hypothetical protein
MLRPGISVSSLETDFQLTACAPSDPTCASQARRSPADRLEADAGARSGPEPTPKIRAREWQRGDE